MRDEVQSDRSSRSPSRLTTDLRPAFANVAQELAHFFEVRIAVAHRSLHQLLDHVFVEVVEPRCDLAGGLEIEARLQLTDDAYGAMDELRLLRHVAPLHTAARDRNSLERPVH